MVVWFAVKTWEDQTVATNGQPSPRYHTRSVIITLEDEHKQPTTMQLVVINNLISHLIRCFPHPTQDWHYRKYDTQFEIITFFGGCCWTKRGLVGKYGSSSLPLLPGQQQQQQQPGMPGMFTSPLFVTSITPLLLPSSRSPQSKTVPKSERVECSKNSLFPADEGRWRFK